MNSCNLYREDREFLESLPKIPKLFSGADRPESVGVEWHHTENQGAIGSCQGNSLTSCIERCEFVAELPEVQLSRIQAYLRTQRKDGLLGADRGSTISGGAWVALNEGVCPESLTGYPLRYPGTDERKKILSEELLEAGSNHKIASLWKVPRDPEEARNWIGNGGAISIGILWPGLPTNRTIERYRGGRGGHAVAVLGYDSKYLIAVNSWGDGPFRISNDAWTSMWGESYTAMVGMAGDTEPEPKPIDFPVVHMDW